MRAQGPDFNSFPVSAPPPPKPVFLLGVFTEYARKGGLCDGGQLRHRVLRRQIPSGTELHRSHGLPEQRKGGGCPKPRFIGYWKRGRPPPCR